MQHLALRGRKKNLMSILKVEENICVQRPDKNCATTASRAANPGRRCGGLCGMMDEKLS